MILSCPACSARNRVPPARLSDRPTCGSCRAPLDLGAPLEVADEAEFDELIRDAPLPLLVDFWAPWCGPCRTVTPEIAKVARAHEGRLLVAKVNTDELGNVAARFEVASIPTLGYFRGGRLVQREVGARGQRAIEQVFSLG